MYSQKTYKPRMSGVELPTMTEVLEILAKESPRQAVHFNFPLQNKHLFDAYIEVAKLAGEDASWTYNYKEIPFEILAQTIITTQQRVGYYIHTHTGDNKSLYEKLYSSLIPVQHETKSDAIFVFGSLSNARIERAIELYQNGMAPQIILSGNSPHYMTHEETEAKRMAKVAIAAGVPESALILEEASITLPDNVKRTIDLFENTSWRPQVITIVATDFVLQRACMEWYKFLPWHITIQPVAARPQSIKFTKEGWYQYSDSIALVLNEYAKMIFESKVDLIRQSGQSTTLRV